jgi:hypothetical protein
MTRLIQLRRWRHYIQHGAITPITKTSLFHLHCLLKVYLQMFQFVQDHLEIFHLYGLHYFLGRKLCSKCNEHSQLQTLHVRP